MCCACGNLLCLFCTWSLLCNQILVPFYASQRNEHLSWTLLCNQIWFQLSLPSKIFHWAKDEKSTTRMSDGENKEASVAFCVTFSSATRVSLSRTASQANQFEYCSFPSVAFVSFFTGFSRPIKTSDVPENDSTPPRMKNEFVRRSLQPSVAFPASRLGLHTGWTENLSAFVPFQVFLVGPYPPGVHGFQERSG